MTSKKDFPSPLYSELGVRYQQAYSGPYQDLSISAYDVQVGTIDKTVVIAALKDNQITGFGRPVLAVGKRLKEAAEQLYEISPNIWYRDELVNGSINDFSRFLIEKGVKPELFYTQLIDLSKNEDELHSEVRKSYKSLLNKDQNLYVLDWNSDGLYQYYKRFKLLHIEQHGRQTRSDETWQLHKEQILAKEAFIVVEQDDIYSTAKLKAAGLFIYNNYCCYYGVGCSAEGAGNHAIIWRAILYAKELGCSSFDMGEQVFEGDEKLVNISKFKRGFGGETKVCLEFNRTKY